MSCDVDVVLSVRVNAGIRALQWGAWPALVGLSVALTALALKTHRVDPELAAVVGGLLSGLACLALERAIPYERAWSESKGDVRSDFLHAMLGLAVVPAVLRAACAPSLVRAAHALGAWAGRSDTLWPGRWPLAAQVLLALLASELGGYAVHRVQHKHRWAWPVHAIHHDARRVYFFNGPRLHPGDTVMTLLATAFPLMVLGAPADVMALVSAFASAHIPLQHVNADLRFGLLEYVVATPTLHRWHHSREPREAESNYGGLLIVWDLLFGTYLNPRDRRPPVEVGLYAGESLPATWWKQVLWPLQRWLGRA